jgi:hypothetical protein
MLTGYAVSLLSINIQKRTCNGRETDLQAKPEEEQLISFVILFYLCLDADLFCLATTQHVTGRGGADR